MAMFNAGDIVHWVGTPLITYKVVRAYVSVAGVELVDLEFRGVVYPGYAARKFVLVSAAQPEGRDIVESVFPEHQLKTSPKHVMGLDREEIDQDAYRSFMRDL